MASLRNRTAKLAILHLATCVAALLSVLAAPSVRAQAQAQRIAIDPETGRVRAPEADELPAARANAGAARAAATTSAARASASPEERAKPVAGVRFGARGFRVDPTRMSFTVVRRSADGLITTQCVAGETAVEHAMHAAVLGGAHDH